MLSYNRFIIISWYSITIRSTYRNNWKLNDIWNRLQYSLTTLKSVLNLYPSRECTKESSLDLAVCKAMSYIN